MELPYALLIDLDDTILDTTLSADRNWLRVAEAASKRGIDIDPEVFVQHMLAVREWYWSDTQRSEQGRLVIEKARAEMIAETLRRLHYRSNHFDQYVADMQTDFTTHRIDAMQLMPGVLDALKAFKARGIKTALMTNGQGDMQRTKVNKFDLTPLFDAILIEGELGFGKPTEKFYYYALDQLGVAAAETWAIGDNLHWEVDAPQQLGMKGIWIDWRREGLPSTSDVTPDLIIHSLADLLQS
ncbi:HAD family hydrolase [Poriferisphaera sp. WC338]|uniref:HAD family hydrolase n=1 Tax=Poriferisphaera sp. WC338 TaxID=3425129 RepID=UPI003D815001